MTTVVSGALLLTASTLLGLSIKALYRERLECFILAKEFAEFYYREVKSLKTKVPDVINDFIEGRKGIFIEMLRGYLECVNEGDYELLDIKKRVKSYKLKDEDNNIISEFIYMLGRNDYETELTKISNYIKIFEEKTSKYTEILKKNGDMYYKLSIVLGLCIWLIIL